MTADRHAGYSEPIGQWSLWFGILGGAGAWALHLVVSYALVPAACSAGLDFLMYPAIPVFVATAVVAIFLSWRGWNLTKDTPDENDNGQRLVLQRIRFMALSGMATSGFFLLVIIVQSVPIIMQNPCEAAGSIRI